MSAYSVDNEHVTPNHGIKLRHSYSAPVTFHPETFGPSPALNFSPMILPSSEDPEQPPILPRARCRSFGSEVANADETEFNSLFNCSELRFESEEQPDTPRQSSFTTSGYVCKGCLSGAQEGDSGVYARPVEGSDEFLAHTTMRPPRHGCRERRMKPPFDIESLATAAKECLQRLELQAIEGFHEGTHTEPHMASALTDIEYVRSCVQSYQTEMLRLKDVIKSLSAKIYISGGETLSHTDITDDASVTSEVVYDPVEQTIDTLEELSNRLDQDPAGMYVSPNNHSPTPSFAHVSCGIFLCRFIEDTEKRKIWSLTQRICCSSEEFAQYSDGSEAMSSSTMDAHSGQRKRQRQITPHAAPTSLNHVFNGFDDPEVGAFLSEPSQLMAL